MHITAKKNLPTLNLFKNHLFEEKLDIALRKEKNTSYNMP